MDLLTKDPKNTAKNAGNATQTGQSTADAAKKQAAAQSTGGTKSTTGTQYDPSVDYSAMIDSAVGSGDYLSAAKLEQQRNAKITGEGLDYGQTNRYASYLPGGSDYIDAVLSGVDRSNTDSIYSAYRQLISQGVQPTDLTSYLQQLYDANLKAQQAALGKQYAGYEETLDAEKEKAQQAADKSMTQEAVSAQQAQRAWNEAQSAYGLSSGAQGQIAVSRANQTQGDIAAIRAAQQAADAEIERQRTQYKEQYAAALLEAAAQNDTQRAQALYEEMVRQDNALQQQQQQSTEWALSYLSGVGSSGSGYGGYRTSGDDDDPGAENYYRDFMDQLRTGIGASDRAGMLDAISEAEMNGNLTGKEAEKLRATVNRLHNRAEGSNVSRTNSAVNKPSGRNSRLMV